MITEIVIAPDRHSQRRSANPGGYGARGLAEILLSDENRPMTAKLFSGEETPEQAAEAISASLDFLRQEADAAGLTDVGALLGQASAKAQARSKSVTSSDRPAVALLQACEAIVSLPPEYRAALVLRKVYRRSWHQIAGDCSVSVDTAKERAIKGFQLVRALLRANPA